MKRLKSYKSLFESLTNFQNDKSYLEDVLQELKDRGFSFDVHQKLPVPNRWHFRKLPLKVFSKPCLLIYPPSSGYREGFSFRDVENEVKHITSYLGDRILEVGAVFIHPNRPVRRLMSITGLIDTKMNSKYLDDKFAPDKLSELAIFFDSSNTIEERYRYIDILQLGDFEDNLAYIEKTFLKIPKDEILDIITELENLGLQIDEGHLSPILWKGESLNQKRITTSFSETLLYLETEDFYKMSSDSIFSKKSVKYMSSEALDYIFKTKSEMEITQIMDHDAIRGHFFDKIKEEAREFESLISDGWIPGLAISKIKQLKNWQQSPEKIDLLFSITERLEEFLDYQMVFFPKAEEPSIIFIERKYIKY